VEILPINDPARMRGKPKVPPIVPKDLLPRLSGLDWIDLRRSEGMQRVVIVLPDGDSYSTTIRGFLWALERLGISNGESVADYLWNFREATLDLKAGVCVQTYERNRKIGRP